MRLKLPIPWLAVLVRVVPTAFNLSPIVRGGDLHVIAYSKLDADATLPQSDTLIDILFD